MKHIDWKGELEMEQNPANQSGIKVSVIIPVYNMDRYLDQSLSSWAAQTMDDIEIICIDDGSTDQSYTILQKWAETNHQFKIHHFSRNQSPWMARKFGVAHSKGDYILFADADDEISSNACEELYAEMQKQPVDILHFDAEIINVNHVSEKRIQNMQNFVRPYNGNLYGKEVLTACFEKQKYHFSLWNKMFSGALCRRALADAEDLFLPKAQDKLTYFILAYFAQSYRGLPDRKYYHYFFGRGSTGHNKLNLQQFEVYCSMARVANAMHRFLERQNADKVYADLDQKSRTELLQDCLMRWISEVPEHDKAQAFDLMISSWKCDEVICMLAERKWYDRYAVAHWLKNSQFVRYDHHEVKTIATYYHTCNNGGVQRVLCNLANLWTAMGYRVILLTDSPASQDDYALPSGIKRIVVPHYQSIDKNTYKERFHVIVNALQEYHVDVVVYHAWVMNLMLWDELAIKSTGAAFVAHCHNIFSLPILNGWKNPLSVLGPYYIADAVITLSDADQAFWNHINANVYKTINPMPQDARDLKPTYGTDRHDVLWLGRMSPEKQPQDALTIIQKVMQHIPDARLHIVGSSSDPRYMEQFNQLIQSMGIQANVVMHGFCKDVQQFYNNSSVFLMTSAYEGYPLTLQESKLSGIPCVMYELPYLTLCQGNHGIMPVPQNDTTAAANAIIDLFLDEEKRLALGHQAREHIETFFDFDHRALWRCIFQSLTQPHELKVSLQDQIMLDTLLYHHELGLNKSENKKASQKEKRCILL